MIIPATDMGLRPGEKATIRLLANGTMLLRRIMGSRSRTRGVVDAAAGMFQDRPEAADAILRSRLEER